MDRAPARRAGDRRERGKRDKLERIVRVASALFAERGFEATTTQAIAEEAGIGAGTLFLYVRSKDDLLVRVVLGRLGRSLDAAAAGLPGDASPLDGALALLGPLAAELEGDPGLGRAFLKQAMFVSDTERPGVEALFAEVQRHLAGIVAGSAPLAAAGLPAADVAANLFAVFFHLLQLRHGGHVAPAELPARLRGALAVQLGAVGLGGPAAQPGRRATK